MSYDTDHTTKAYSGLSGAYAFFNEKLFGNQLPPCCLITVQRKKGCYGYYSHERFSASEEMKTDEIALNPATFALRTPKEVLSTLVHEMVHLWQFHFGEPSRTGYHNKEWAIKMKEVGLWPSSTGQVGGKETGAKVSHYIIKHNKFCANADEFLKLAAFVLYADNRTEAQSGTAKKKAASKTKYTCEMCGTNAWAKPDTKLKCGTCDEMLKPEEAELPLARVA